MATAPKYRYTVEEYFELESNSVTKHAFFGGEIFAMAGASLTHALIVTNTAGELRSLLKHGNCRVTSTDLRLKVSPTGLYTYPDVMVVCGDIQYADGRRDTIENPTVAVEVLSPSTEEYDRGAKFEHYKRIKTLAEYLLISQDERRVEHRQRQTDGTWLITTATGAEIVRLTSIACELPLDEIYDKVEFPA